MEISMNKTINNIKYILLFTYILLIYLYGGNEKYTYTYKIVMALLIGFQTMDIIKTKKICISINIIALYLFSFFAFTSSFWAINGEYSIIQSKTIFLLTTFLLFIYNFIKNEKDGVYKLMKIIIFAGVTFSLYIFLFYGINTFFNMLLQGKRIGAEIDNVNNIGIETAFTFLLCFYFGISFNKIYLLLSILPLIVSLGTGSRKVVIGLIIGLLGIVFTKTDKNKIKGLLKKIFFIASLVLVIILIVNTMGQSSIVKRFLSFGNLFSNNKKADSSTIERKKFIIYGLKQFTETPILGIGIGNSGYVTMKAAGWFTYLHNNYVELLATGGIIGFSLFYFNYTYLIFNIFKNRKYSKYSMLLIVLLCLLLLLDMASVTYYSKSHYIYLLLAICVLDSRIKEKGTIKYEDKKIYRTSK